MIDLVFCAVTATRTDSANTPFASIALMSPWMPAPPPESEVAMVRAWGMMRASVIRVWSAKTHAL